MSTLTLSKLFEPAALTNSLSTLYTVPTSPSSTILKDAAVRLTNVTAGAITVDVHCVPLSGSATDANAILKGFSIPANDYRDVDLPNMKAGDFIRALASANSSITIHCLSGNLFA